GVRGQGPRGAAGVQPYEAETPAVPGPANSAHDHCSGCAEGVAHGDFERHGSTRRDLDEADGVADFGLLEIDVSGVAPVWRDFRVVVEDPGHDDRRLAAVGMDLVDTRPPRVEARVHDPGAIRRGRWILGVDAVVRD